MKTISNGILILILSISFYRCQNQYEKKIDGVYKVSKYSNKDTLFKCNITELKLSNDNTFKLKLENKEISGKWNAGDNGDWTFVNFNFDDKEAEVEGRVGSSDMTQLNIINFLNPDEFYCPKCDNLTLIKKE